MTDNSSIKRHQPTLHRSIRSNKNRVNMHSGAELQVSRGRPYPLGATVKEDGVQFAVYSRHARKVSVALFDSVDSEPSVFIPLPNYEHGIWHGLVKGIGAGQLYALTADGPWDPLQGHRFNPQKFLLDPYTKALAGEFKTTDHLHLSYDADHQDKDLVLDPRSNAKVIPKCVVVNQTDFDWQGVAQPNILREEWVIYEAHLKGFTAHPSSGVKHPGTYLGVIEKIEYLKSLGINAVEFLPIQAKYNEDHLTGKGMVNFWGYNTAAFFALEPSYASSQDPLAPIIEFKTLVRELHRAGIEVIMDVVFNHTPEANELGPTICFKGLDNASYYAFAENHGTKRFYRNVTGCGNTLDFGNPAVVRLTLDALRYFAEEFQIDGFRFDLATVVGRALTPEYDVRAPFLQAIAADPILCRVKLIAEPWDLEVYSVGAFPQEWAEWNGRFRDTVRRFVKGDAGQLGDLGWRLTGSADEYAWNGRNTDASINFITCHDGFTLKDLVSYNGKHNENNGENNCDGNDGNDSWNCGVEGETTDSEIISLRHQQARNLMTLLLLSYGVPMINAGDEGLRSQNGNNNAYCHDDEIGWVNWNELAGNRPMFDFVKELISLRKQLPIFKIGEFVTGEDHDGDEAADVQWFNFRRQTPEWNNPNSYHLGFCLDPDENRMEKNERSPELCRRLCFLLNSESRDLDFLFPAPVPGHAWHLLINTFGVDAWKVHPVSDAVPISISSQFLVMARSIVVLAEKPIT